MSEKFSKLLLWAIALSSGLILIYPSNAVGKKFKVVTTFTVLADIAKNVAGDAAIVESIAKAGSEIHNYQPTPHDIIKTQGADLVLWNGLDLENWFEKFFQDIEDVPVEVMTKGIVPISIFDGPYKGYPNPHAWMSIENGLIYIDNVYEALKKYDPENAMIYKRNAEDYAEQLLDLKINLIEKLSIIPKDKRFLVTSEGGFSYLARELDMQDIYLWATNADQQGTPQQVRNVLNQVRKHNIPVVFSESTISDKPAKQLALEANVAYGGVLYVETLSGETGQAPTYLDMLVVTTSTIADAFKQALSIEKNSTKK
ncbi:MAG: zinc ABC transporter substrate-binding protein [SAR324 cluster bacterium]|nr:zinc ABC transporter substrate-binding protein [SAR324 cluster bacterium]